MDWMGWSIPGSYHHRLFDIVEQELAMTDPDENLGLFGPAGPHPDPLAV
jgi:hypothetical protein